MNASALITDVNPGSPSRLAPKTRRPRAEMPEFVGGTQPPQLEPAPQDILCGLLQPEPPKTVPSLFRVLNVACAATLSCAVFGLALGAGNGILSALEHGLRLGFTSAEITVLSLPLLYVLTLNNSDPLSLQHLLSAVSRSALATGLVLASALPLFLLFQLTLASTFAVQGVAAVFLFAAFAIGLLKLLLELTSLCPQFERFGPRCALAGYAMFAFALSVRIWSALPFFATAEA